MLIKKRNLLIYAISTLTFLRVLSNYIVLEEIKLEKLDLISCLLVLIHNHLVRERNETLVFGV